MQGRNWSCQFCQAEGLKKYNITRFKKPFDIWQCPNCGLMYQYPIPSSREIEEYYQESYYSGDSQFSYEDERKNFKFYSYVWKKRIKKLKKNIKTENPDKSLLDIGCSFGGLLKNAQNQGFKAYGIELSDYSRTYAKQFIGPTVFKNFEEADLKENSLDAITMIELIEHLQNPGEILKKCYELLRPGGILLIQTANMEGNQAKKEGENYHYFLPGHLYYFSKSNLRNQLKKLGFKKVKFFHPVEFGLIPKLRKSRQSFKTIKDYLKWINISYYHFKSWLHFRDYCFTSSMVLYAWK